MNEPRSRQPGSGRTEELRLSMQEMITLAVEGAVSEALRNNDSSQHAIQIDCRGELKQMRELVTTGFHNVNSRLDDFREQLAVGNTKFAVLEVQHKHLSDAMVKVDNDRGRPRRSSSPAAAVDPDAAPLINPKVWNALILAVVAALGTGLGALIWERVRRPDPITSAPPAIYQPLAQPPQPTPPAVASHAP